jgi:regulator of extracellular matrix RemA (YlzA/DUF370 family)
MKFINIGFGNMVSAGRIVAITCPDSAPVKRLVQDAKDGGRAIDVTCGRKTRSVLVLDSDHVLLSAIQPETVVSRLMGSESVSDEDDLAMTENKDRETAGKRSGKGKTNE